MITWNSNQAAGRARPRGSFERGPRGHGRAAHGFVFFPDGIMIMIIITISYPAG